MPDIFLSLEKISLDEKNDSRWKHQKLPMAKFSPFCESTNFGYGKPKNSIKIKGKREKEKQQLNISVGIVDLYILQKLDLDT